MKNPFNRDRRRRVSDRCTRGTPRSYHIRQSSTTIRHNRSSTRHLSKRTRECSISRVNRRNVTRKLMGAFHVTCHGIFGHVRIPLLSFVYSSVRFFFFLGCPSIKGTNLKRRLFRFFNSMRHRSLCPLHPHLSRFKITHFRASRGTTPFPSRTRSFNRHLTSKEPRVSNLRNHGNVRNPIPMERKTSVTLLCRASTIRFSHVIPTNRNSTLLQRIRTMGFSLQARLRRALRINTTPTSSIRRVPFQPPIRLFRTTVNRQDIRAIRSPRGRPSPRSLQAAHVLWGVIRRAVLFRVSMFGFYSASGSGHSCERPAYSYETPQQQVDHHTNPTMQSIPTTEPQYYPPEQ